MLDPLEVLGGGPADYPHHPVALGEEEVGQVGAGLAGNAVVEGGGFPHRFSFRTSRKKQLDTVQAILLPVALFYVKIFEHGQDFKL